MKIITLIRHADALSEPVDRTRSLSLAGWQQLESIRMQLKDKLSNIEYVLCSNAKRCRQTYEGLQKSLPDGIEERFTDELYNTNLEGLLSILRSVPQKYENIVVIGHNPALSDFISHCNFKTFPISLSTANIAFLYSPATEWKGVAPNKFEITDFIAPKNV